MSENYRLPDYLDHIQQAAIDARSFVEGLTKEDFFADKRSQQAVIMSFIIIGEAATKAMDGYAKFTQAHPEVPWRSMRNMRNRMAHGYFDINLDVVWETVQEWLPALLRQLPAVRLAADDEDRNDSGMEP
ncbi:HepT-like ribonuclease domain-containing protein [Delftia lacustris]